jgi:hypothetical protein
MQVHDSSNMPGPSVHTAVWYEKATIVGIDEHNNKHNREESNETSGEQTNETSEP